MICHALWCKNYIENNYIVYYINKAISRIGIDISLLSTFDLYEYKKKIFVKHLQQNSMSHFDVVKEESCSNEAKDKFIDYYID